MSVNTLTQELCVGLLGALESSAYLRILVFCWRSLCTTVWCQTFEGGTRAAVSQCDPSQVSRRRAQHLLASLFATWLILHLNTNVHQSEWLKSGAIIYAKSYFSLFSCTRALGIELQVYYLNGLTSLQNVSPAEHARRWTEKNGSNLRPSSPTTLGFNVPKHNDSKWSIKYWQVLQHGTNLLCSHNKRKTSAFTTFKIEWFMSALLAQNKCPRCNFIDM